MRLVWSRFSLADRESIFAYIEADNPAAAAHIDERIVLAARRLLEFPDSGRSGRISGTRELVIPRTPFIAAYVVTGDTVRILRVVHGAQIWPDEIESN